MFKCCFTSTETVGLLGTGAQDVHLDFHTAAELWRKSLKLKCCSTSTETVGLLGTKPRTATSTLTQLPSSGKREKEPSYWSLYNAVTNGPA